METLGSFLNSRLSQGAFLYHPEMDLKVKGIVFLQLKISFLLLIRTNTFFLDQLKQSKVSNIVLIFVLRTNGASQLMT